MLERLDLKAQSQFRAALNRTIKRSIRSKTIIYSFLPRQYVAFLGVWGILGGANYVLADPLRQRLL
jgi:hypothetical protein